MKTLYSAILQDITNKHPLVEITIIEQSGSAPRTAGTKMLVRHDGSIEGTIGGGLYEGKSMALAKDFLKQKESERTPAMIVYFDLKGKQFPTDMDMVCGGELRLLIEYIDATDENIYLYRSIVEAEKNRQACTLITKITPHDSHVEQGNHTADSRVVSLEKALIVNRHNEQQTININSIPDKVLDYLEKNKNKDIPNASYKDREYVFHSLHKPFTLHIFGGGHVSCELAKIAHYLDFVCVVLDDRAEFSNQERFPHATTLVPKSLEQTDVEAYFKGTYIGENDGIIIVTRGHARDRDVLYCALKTSASYIGMIGSKSKRKATYDFLIQNGYTEQDFEKIHSPIGISIGAQSPQEIAISICAELIAWRSNI